MVPILERRVRGWVVLAIELCIVVIYVTDDPGSLLAIVTVAGHLIAAHIGMLGWQPWLRRRGLVGTLRLPRKSEPPTEDPVRPAARLAASEAP
jgi:hypothetical protein